MTYGKTKLALLWREHKPGKQVEQWNGKHHSKKASEETPTCIRQCHDRNSVLKLGNISEIQRLLGNNRTGYVENKTCS